MTGFRFRSSTPCSTIIYCGLQRCPVILSSNALPLILSPYAVSLLAPADMQKILSALKMAMEYMMYLVPIVLLERRT